jgi:MFS transporter, DHA3 family, macrolide efflux protein
MKHKIAQLNGMQKFSLIWFGQLVSLFGTATTRFALLIWAYDQTQEATTLALLGFFSFINFVLFSPIAGVWVDRLDRRVVMILSDLGAGLMTIAMLVLYTTGNLQIWHLYVAEGLTGAFEAFQLPAYAASVSVLVPKEQYARASGMRSLANNASQMFAPLFAGLILRIVDIDGVMLIDVATFLFAMVTLFIVRIPRPAASAEGKTTHGEPFLRQMSFGFRYIFRRPGLLWLIFVFICINFVAALTWFALLAPMILGRTGGDELALASVQTALGVGGVLGGLAMSVWGGPKRRIHGVLAGTVISFLLGDFVLGAGHSLPVWAAGAFLGSLFIPLIVGSDEAIWQMKVAPDVQGRVFAVRSTIRTAVMPLGFLVAGPLADQVFGPALMPGGSLADTFGWLVGTGPGSGIGLMFVCTSVLGITIGLTGYLFPWVRNVERDLPDHDVEVVKADGMAGNVVVAAET